MKLPISCYACKLNKPLWKNFYRDFACEELNTSELTAAFLEKWMKYNIYEWNTIYIFALHSVVLLSMPYWLWISSPNENFLNNERFWAVAETDTGSQKWSEIGTSLPNSPKM